MADQGTTGSSPWDEALDEKDVATKLQPTVVGDLSSANDIPPVVATEQAPVSLKVPENVEEKVGVKVDANEIINKKPVAENVVSTNIPVNPEPKPVAIPDVILDPPKNIPVNQAASVEDINHTIPPNTAKNQESDDSFWESVYASQEEAAKTAEKGQSVSPNIEVPIENNVSANPVPAPNTEIKATEKTIESDISKKPFVYQPATPSNPVGSSLNINSSPTQPDIIKVATENQPSAEHLLASAKNYPIANAKIPTKTPMSIAGQAQKKSVNNNKIKILVVSVFALLILFFSLGIFLTERGIISFGLEKIYGVVHLEAIWGGLPVNSGNAFAMSAVKTKSKKSFDLTGNATLTVNRGVKSDIISPILSVSAFPIIALSDENVGKKIPAILTAVATESTSPSTSQSPTLGTVEEVKAEINAGFSDDSSGADITLSSKKSQESNISLTYNNSHLYLKSSSDIVYKTDAKGSWIKYDLNSYKGQNVASDFLGSNFSSSDFSMTGNRVGSDTIDNVRCFHYTSDVVIGNSLYSFGLDSESVQNTELEFWVGIKDHLLRKAVIKIVTNNSSAISRIESTIDLSNFESAKNIYPIPAAFVPAIDNNSSSSSVSSPVFSQPSSDQTSAIFTSRDNQRKTDLAKIASALDRYFLIYDSYPKTTGSEKTGLSSSKIYSALVPNYLTEMPLDPAPEKYYYGYESDGLSYRLSAVLENINDSEGKKVGSLQIYYLSNN